MSNIPAGLSTALADRYTIERELGAGGMATVYLALDLRHERKVAIKVLRPELAAVIGAERFLREIKTIATLQHPHILGLIDSGELNGTAYYVMPYVEGESLRERLVREKQLPIADAVRIATEVAGALDYAHRHGVIHRDIKPENVLLHDGSALVADFGIALAVSSAGATRMTETGMSLGTPHYMSPEQAMGEREITARSDVYALGAMTYEMLVGDPPFTGSTAQAIVAKVVTESPHPLLPQRHTIPPQVEAAVLAALEKLPADRFATAAEFADALSRPELRPTTGTRAMPAVAASSAATARRWRLATLASVLVLGTVAGMGWIAARRASHSPASWQYISLGDSTSLSPSAPFLALSKDGNTLIFKDGGQNGLLWIKRRGQLDPTPLAGTEGAMNPVLSPDDQWVAFVADGRLKKIRLSGGAAMTLAENVAGGYGGAAWLDDGNLVYVIPELSELRRVRESGEAGGTALKDSTLSGGGIGMPVALPGARGVLFQYCSSGCVTMSIHVLDLRTGAQRPLLDEAAQAWYLPGGRLLYARRDGVVMTAPFDLKTLEITGTANPVLEGVDVQSLPGYAALAWSPAGTLVYVAGTSTSVDNTVVRVSREGLVTPIDTAWHGSFNSMALSPDGRRLAVGVGAGSGLNIWIKQIGSGPFSRLSFGNTDRRPEWAPDGSRVAFIRDSAGSSAVYTRPVDGSGADQLVARLDRQVQEVSWTHDGQWLVLRTDNGEPGAGDLVGVRTRGDTTPVPLVATAFTELNPEVSPDGRWLAYASNESGVNEIYVRPFPRTDGGRWQVSNGGGITPRWSRDGRELFYLGPDLRLFAVPVTPGPVFTAGEPRPLFSAAAFALEGAFHQAYSVAPDGRSFFFRMQNRSATAGNDVRVVWVDHWLQDVQRRLAR
ncbi:MAG: protein kinase [Gemmatimonadales bacterium]